MKPKEKGSIFSEGRLFLINLLFKENGAFYSIIHLNRIQLHCKLYIRFYIRVLLLHDFYENVLLYDLA